MNKNLKIELVIVIAAIVILIATFGVHGCVWCDAGDGSDDDESCALNSVDELAQRLTESGAKMYGAYWCGHCNNQKELFGESFQYVSYVECTEETETCQSAGITGYPTWILGDGTVLIGEQSLEHLAEMIGCEFSE